MKNRTAMSLATKRRVQIPTIKKKKESLGVKWIWNLGCSATSGSTMSITKAIVTLQDINTYTRLMRWSP